MVSPNQGAFVRGRWIAENSVIAQEVIHKVRKHKRKQGLMVMKLDMKKAYDSMEWNFIFQVLQAWGLNEHLNRLIHSCLSSVNFSLLINGSISKNIQPRRGL